MHSLDVEEVKRKSDRYAAEAYNGSNSAHTGALRLAYERGYADGSVDDSAVLNARLLAQTEYAPLRDENEKLAFRVRVLEQDIKTHLESLKRLRIRRNRLVVKYKVYRELVRTVLGMRI